MSQRVYKIFVVILNINCKTAFYVIYICPTTQQSSFSFPTHSYKSCVSTSSDCNCLNCKHSVCQQVELQFGMHQANDVSVFVYVRTTALQVLQLLPVILTCPLSTWLDIPKDQ